MTVGHWIGIGGGVLALLGLTGDLARFIDAWVGPPALRFRHLPKAMRRRGCDGIWTIETRSRRRAIATLLRLASPPRSHVRRPGEPWQTTAERDGWGA